MCGICGVVFAEPGKVSFDALRKANSLIRHRGPDDDGYHTDDHVALAMRRLAIIDLSTGKQPISSPDGEVTIVFNGEIYNYRELRPELEKEGYPFKTKSDTEVIVALYLKYGPECVRRLRGMFAFALWDKPKRRLVVARDRIGKKPLVYSYKDGRLAFASEMRCLFELAPISKEIDPKAIDLFLSLQYIPSPRTIYHDVQKLPPAHYLLWEGGHLSEHRYWDLPLGQQSITKDPEEAKVLLRDKLIESTRLRMISDVPLGAFLSGGIDSSIVVACMAGLSERPVKTFSIGFEEEEFSELPYAREVARRYGTDHREFVVKAEMADVLPKLAWHYGEPYADASALPSYYVARETRRHVTVALNGDGGDENFAGYVRYFAMKAARLYDWLPGPAKKAIMAGAELLPEKDAPFSTLWKAKRFLRSAMFTDLPGRHLKMVCYFSEEDKKGLYSPEMLSRLGASSAAELEGAKHYLANAFSPAAGEDFVNQLLYADIHSYLPECLMAKVDIATMANSLEGRSPFLDHEFMELAFRLPGDWKLKGLKGHKWILKEAFRDKLPASILTRPKMGFGIPLGPWFRGRLRDYWRDLVLSDRALARGYFERAALQRLFDQHQARVRDHGYRMWALLMLELWHRECLEKGSDS